MRQSFALHVRADGQAEFLAQSCTYGRLSVNDMFGGSAMAANRHRVILLSQSACRTYGNTLSAGYREVSPRPISKAEPISVAKPTMVSADHANALCLVTYSHTRRHRDTFAVVADHVGSGVVNLRRCLFPVIISLVLNTQLMSQLLKLAVPAADTGQAGAVVVG